METLTVATILLVILVVYLAFMIWSDLAAERKAIKRFEATTAWDKE